MKENWKRSSGGGGIGSAWAAGNPFVIGKAPLASPGLGPIGAQRGVGRKNGDV